MRELLERRPKIVTSESDQLVDLHHVGHHDLSKNDRRDPETANDPDGCQIETIMLDHQSPDHRYSLHPGELVFAKSWEEEDNFTLFSVLATLVCIVSYIINIGTDVAVSYLLFVEGNFWWFGFTVASTAIPALTVNIFSIRWYMHDAQETKSQSEALAKPYTSKTDWIMRIFFHIILLGPVLRYIDLLIYGLRSRKLHQQKQHEERHDWHLTFRKASPVTIDQSRDVNYHLLMIQEDRDTALLALLESFMESAPQLVLQIYILAQREEVPAEFLTVCFQVASVISSLFELSWALAFYQRALRRSVLDKKNMTRIGTALQFLWRFCTIGARVLALALFTSEYKLWTVPVCVGHWGIMTVWIMHQHTDFCGNNAGEKRQCEEYLFNMVIGVIYLFCFLNIKDEPTRYKITVYYIIVFLENFILIVLWYIRTDPNVWYHLPAFVSVFASSLVGVSIMTVYYHFCHPKGKLPEKDHHAACC